MSENRAKKVEQYLPLLIGVLVVCLVVAVTMGTWTIVQGSQITSNQADIEKTQKDLKTEKQIRQGLEFERQERTNQNCEILERVHLQDVEDARREIRDWRITQGYIKSGELGPQLTLAVKRNLPQAHDDLASAWSRAAIDVAPPYCDGNNLGLPEPDPLIPDWPEDAGPEPDLPGKS